MASHSHTVRLSDSIFAALQEAAEREHKSVEEVAGEAILRGLARREERPSTLLPVMERIGRQQQERGGAPDERQIAEAVRAHRRERRRD